MFTIFLLSVIAYVITYFLACFILCQQIEGLALNDKMFPVTVHGEASLEKLERTTSLIL